MISVFLSVAAVALLTMGLVALISPQHVMSYFGVPTTADLRNEVGAVYGGYGVAMAILVMIAMQSPHYRAGILLTLAAAMGGMAVGRLLRYCRESSGRWPLVFLGVEVLAAGGFVAALIGGA